MMELVIDRSGDFAIARATGEIRAEDGERFVEELHPLVAEPDSVLAIDLSGVVWLDSAGLTSLINVVTHSRLSGGRTILIAPTAFVAGVFEVTNLNKWFDIVDSQEEAVKRFRRTG